MLYSKFLTKQILAKEKDKSQEVNQRSFKGCDYFCLIYLQSGFSGSTSFKKKSHPYKTGRIRTIIVQAERAVKLPQSRKSKALFLGVP